MRNAQDRWSLAKPLLVEYGLRADRDSVIHDWIAQPNTPRLVNWSAAVERMLPLDIYFKAEYQQKRGESGFTFFNIDNNPGNSGTYLLRSLERRKYDALMLSAQKKLKGNHELFLSYVRSSAWSNAVVPFSLSSPLFGQQVGGPLPWDAPHHLVSWGWLPLSSKFDFAYALDWRTGFPFLVVNQLQQIVLPAASRSLSRLHDAELARRTPLSLSWARVGGTCGSEQCDWKAKSRQREQQHRFC